MPSDPRHPESNTPGYERFVGLLTRHEPALRRFVRTLLPGWSDVDEVMQRTALAAWRKFGQFDPTTDFLKWGLVIARFEALAFRRAMGRDRLVFSESFLEKLAEEADDETELAGREERALEGCLQKLSPERRELVLKAYADGTDQRDVAAAIGKSPAAFYMLLARIRRDLADCIERTLKQEALT
jgi:RNA polymerase sigma-70 factor (ECF subfamily)